MKLVKKMVVIFLGVIMMCQGLNASTNNNLEGVYDNKIKAIQSLPDTYVIGNTIGDFNGDGVNDLLVTTLKMADEVSAADIVNIGFTYKNGQLIRIADNKKPCVKVVGNLYSGTATPTIQVMKVSTADNKKSMLKICNGCSYSTTFTYLKMGKNNGDKWEVYLEKYVGSDKPGMEGKKYYKLGKEISEQQYNKEISYYTNSKNLYSYNCNDGGRINPKAVVIAGIDKYNSKKEIIINPNEEEGARITLKYVEKPYLNKWDGTPFDWETIY